MDLQEYLVSLTKKGIEGLQEISQMMVDLRNPLKEINGQRVIMVEDYQSSTATNLLDDSVTEMDLPKSNVIYYTEDGSNLCQTKRNGTENKITSV
jgi:hypothetical protein